jgi:hypothetical protein
MLPTLIAVALPELEGGAVRRAVVQLHCQRPAGVFPRCVGFPDVSVSIRGRVIREAAAPAVTISSTPLAGTAASHVIC